MLSVQAVKWVLVFLVLLATSHVFGHGMSDAEKQAITEGGNLRYLQIGITHMITGYDHLAFVFGVVFFLTKFKDIIKYVTAFTIGHSITLVIATFMAIKINYFLIDAIIALSVVYIAFHNLGGFKKYFGSEAPNLLATIFGLGLIHGLGLSTRLQQLPLSFDRSDMLMNIISFNVGIEIGQIGALAVMLVLIAMLRKSSIFERFTKVANVFLIALGSLLFLQQMHGYEHSENAEEYINTQDYVTKADLALQQSDWKDTIEVIIPAEGEIEYKLAAAKSATLQYAWASDKGDLFFDFHGEPKGDTSGYFESYGKDTKAQSNGSITTPFEGTHGWYWRNDNDFAVTVTLKVKGDYQRMD